MKKNREQKISATKRRSIIVAIVLSLILLISGSLALFTSRTSSDFEAKAGTVVLEIAGLNLTNSTNINPGDMDPDNSGDEFSGGTPHELTYNLYATGNKSTRTRQTILITADRAGESEDLLDASVFKLFVHGTHDELFAKEVIDEKTGIVIQGRYYILSNDTEIKDLAELDELRKEDETLFVKAVKYFWMGNIYDGVGPGAEKEDPNKLESIVPGVKLVQEDKNGDVKESFVFDFGMMRNASNKYQGCDIHIDVIAESMQYRNTDDTDWALVAIVDKSYSTAQAHLSTVPATNENKYGDELYESENVKDSEWKASQEAEKNKSEETTTLGDPIESTEDTSIGTVSGGDATSESGDNSETTETN